MTNEGNLKVTTRSDREIVMTRAFDAPRKLVFDAFTKPELVTLTPRLEEALVDPPLPVMLIWPEVALTDDP